jgi:glycerol-3-phosphate dehydrogenase subunit B
MLDTVVVGGGLAGLTAAVRLVQAGQRVLVVAKGEGSTYLSGGTIDVLGYTPERVESPRSALPELAAERPEHPYARLAPDLVAESLDWFRGAVEPLEYVGGLDENMLLPTAVGAVRPTALVSRSMAAGDLRQRPRMLVAGFRAHKDFYPEYVSDNLRLGGFQARATVVEANPRPGEADVSGLVIAAALDGDRRFLVRLAEELAVAYAPGEVIGVPAVLGASRAPDVWAELQERVGTQIFEIPTLPPSVPGFRLQRRLQDALRRAGGRLIVGSEAVGAESSNGAVSAIVVQDSARRRPYRARSFVLATGGFATGGLVLGDDGAVREPVLGLPVSGLHDDGALFGRRYFDSHPLSSAGIEVDESLRPVDAGGVPLYRNVHVVGAMLAGAEPWKEKSGDGISLASGYRAAGAVLQEAA